jgi:hypothetical protein
MPADAKFSHEVSKVTNRYRQNIHESGATTMKYLLPVFLTALAPCLFAATLTQPSFQIELDSGWAYSIGVRHESQDGPGNLINIRNPNRIGVLKLQSLSAPDAVSQEILREMTNVNFSEHLAWESWGDFSGYRYSYFEGDAYFRQWWLTHEETIIFFVFTSMVEPDQTEKDEIDKIVRSIKAS